MAFIRRSFIAGYSLVVALALVEPSVPRIFWTVIMPLVPLVVVMGGFATWRRLCPIASLAALGATLRRGRRLPPVVGRHPLTLSLGVLMLALSLRLLVANGDGAALAAMLVALVVLAAVVNRIGGGKSWCNHLCPVGVVERIYTDPGPLGDGSAACAACTGCRRRCPDIDAERAYATEVLEVDRQRATFAFPGVVFAFYAYYGLRAGSLIAFFDGRWCETPASWDRVLGPGLYFAAAVPALVAAPLTLLGGAVASYAIFSRLERRFRAAGSRPARHRTLALAAFVAFHLFCGFAGAPAFARWPGAPALVAFVVSAVAVLALLRSAVHTRCEGDAAPTEIMTAKSRKLLAAAAWPTNCDAPASRAAASRRRVALPIIT
jgi:hypothetical protein